jgi:hypothetical protein
VVGTAARVENVWVIDWAFGIFPRRQPVAGPPPPAAQREDFGG